MCLVLQALDLLLLLTVSSEVDHFDESKYQCEVSCHHTSHIESNLFLFPPSRLGTIQNLKGLVACLLSERMVRWLTFLIGNVLRV